ncbi:MAG TPA: hypothetical protein VER11_00215 [Polyangiaceae bacterium]|nr:hypothetical protein [Polyangiaceae bacterium]
MMKRGALSVLGFSLFSVLACGSASDADGGVTNAGSFEGIYRLTAASENLAGCATPGDSKLSQLHEQFFVITASEIFGQKFVTLNSCSSVVDCQAKRAAQQANQPYTLEYTFTLSSTTNATTLTGFEATTGFGQGTQCVERTYADHVLTVAENHDVHLESRTKKLADQPQHDGFCEVEPAKSKQEAESKPCSSLETLDGSFVQAN